MNPEGIDSLAWMPQLAGQLDNLTQHAEIESALNDLEYLMDARDPELQESAYQLVEVLGDKLAKAGA